VEAKETEEKDIRKKLKTGEGRQFFLAMT